MKNSNIILNAWVLNSEGTHERISNSDITSAISSKQLTWIHLNGTLYETKSWLFQHVSHLDGIIIEALLAEETHPRHLTINEGSLIILRGLNLNEGEPIEDMVSIRIWAEANLIITVERRHSKTIQDFEEAIIKGKGPKNTGGFIAQLNSLLLN